MATAIRAGGTVHLLLHFASQDLKLLVGVVLRGEVAAKGEVLSFTFAVPSRKTSARSLTTSKNTLRCGEANLRASGCFKA